MSTFEVNGQRYQALKMPPRDQQHVLRRMLPVLASLAPAVAPLMAAKDGGQAPDAREVLRAVFGAIGPLSETLADMDDERFDYVMNACLLRAERFDADGAWHQAFVRAGSGVSSMYQDISSAHQLLIAREVLSHNLGGFSEALVAALASSPSAGQAGA